MMQILTELTTPNGLTVLAALSLLGLACGCIGTFAALRGRALLSDALAHASLPGICIAYLACGHRSFSALFVGAVTAGLLSVWLIAIIGRYSRIKEDSAIAIILSSSFALGISLIRMIQNTGRGNQAGLEDFIFGKAATIVSNDIILIGVGSAVTLISVCALFKELALITFDREFARAQGLPVLLLDALLMALICLCTATGLPAVGAVLISALLIFPASTARLWTNNLKTVVVLSGAFGLCAALAGALVSIAIPTSYDGVSSGLPTGPVVVLSCAVLFVVSAFLTKTLARRGNDTPLVDTPFISASPIASPTINPDSAPNPPLGGKR